VKKRLVSLFAVVLILQFLTISNQSLWAEPPANHQPMGPRFFGMTTLWFRPWPTLPIGAMRLWNTGTGWADLNPSDGTYNWKVLDNWLSTAQQNGVTQIILTLAMTPRWASSNPDDSCHSHPGQCAPPNDLNPDGSGTDQHWKDFVRAVATHAAGKIGSWEIWNEPVNSYYWSGTFAQMVRMAKDARAIILSINPNALMLSPPNGANLKFGQDWWEGYAALGGLQYADVIALHGGVNLPPFKCGNYPKAVDFVTQVNNLKSILAQYHALDKPIWDTEGDWGDVRKTCFNDRDLQAAFLGQYYLFHESMNIKRFFWFAYDDTAVGQLWDAKTQKLDKAGVAYQYVHDWMVGATMTQNCSSSDNAIWTCDLSAPNGYVAEAIWDTNETCSHGKCRTINYTVDATYTQYRTLDGQTVQISNNQVAIGAKPILLENHNR
jgi:polysaccharide biosynthesis protein PslG